ncbi:hypothetical protein [Pedobacter sp. SYP-B3415]|uniref:hypothetical protein n=1 Tax=Pedobacter sp. SYP-B3415 TaxID=2496641 RepID=UPI00101C38C7|nr:hypothetical protein [Pedobacter sp. SYP-B3415]
MDLRDWSAAVVNRLGEPANCQVFEEEGMLLAAFPPQRLVIHFVSLFTKDTPAKLLSVQARYAQSGHFLIHLWEDVWKARPEQVLSRVRSLLGLDRKIYARQTHASVLDSRATSAFLDDHHLQGAVRAKYRYALFKDDMPVAVATFGPLRQMESRGVQHISTELIRFAGLSGFRITGGLSKLLQHAITELGVQDVMSYADRDWSLGKGYETLGFKLAGETPPLYFELRNGERVRKNNETADCTAKPFNTGSLKYILDV